LNPSQRADLTAKATLLDPDQSKKAHAVIHSCDRRHQLQFVRRLFAMIQKQLLDSGEDRLIAKYFRPLVRHPGALGLTDDAAMLTPPAGCDLILKIDGIIGGVHVFQDDPAELIARKALRVNLSDLAAKGAKPVGFLLSLALPDSISADWLAAFARGLGSDADNYACPLLGGDTDRTPGLLTVYIAAFGIVPQGTMVRRNGARPGDQILVTGSIGDAALGLRLRGDPKMAARWGLDAPRIHRRAARNRPLSERQKSANTTRSKVRARVEHVFGHQQGSMGGKIVRTIGIVQDRDDEPRLQYPPAGSARADGGCVRLSALTGGIRVASCKGPRGHRPGAKTAPSTLARVLHPLAQLRQKSPKAGIVRGAHIVLFGVQLPYDRFQAPDHASRIRAAPCGPLSGLLTS
jgi:AIR synthase related protein, N-terminal domain